MSDRYPPDWHSRRRQVLRRDNFTCQNCGAQGGSYSDTELHVHHSVPISSGGSHNISNLITHCKECHDAIHGTRMAPTAQGRTHEMGTDNIEFPTTGETFIAMMWWALFFLALSIDLIAGGIIFVVWIWTKHKQKDNSGKTNNTSTASVSSPGAITPETGSSVGTATSGNTDAIGSSNEVTAENFENRDNYDLNQNVSDGNEIHSDNTRSFVDDSSTSENLGRSDSEVEQATRFDWYGDDEISVDIVLDHIDTELDSETRQLIKQSVEKHRARGDAVDAADIRWVAEASERLDLEGEHPFN